MKALILPMLSTVIYREGTFDEIKDFCGMETAQRIKVNGHVWLAVDEDGQLKGKAYNPVASSIAQQTILGTVFLVLEN